MCRQRCVMVLVATATWMAAVSARAGYNWGGDGMKEIASGTISNGAVYMQSYGGLGDFVHQLFQRIFDPVYGSRLQRCRRCATGAWNLWWLSQ